MMVLVRSQPAADISALGCADADSDKVGGAADCLHAGVNGLHDVWVAARLPGRCLHVRPLF